ERVADVEAVAAGADERGRDGGRRRARGRHVALAVAARVLRRRLVGRRSFARPARPERESDDERATHGPRRIVTRERPRLNSAVSLLTYARILATMPAVPTVVPWLLAGLSLLMAAMRCLRIFKYGLNAEMFASMVKKQVAAGALDRIAKICTIIPETALGPSTLAANQAAMDLKLAEPPP